MSLAKGAKVSSKIAFTSADSSKRSKPQKHVKDDPSLNEGSFNDLKDKISARLKSTDKRGEDKSKKSKTNTANNVSDQRGKKRAADGTVVKSQGIRHTPNSQEADGEVGDDEAELRKILKELGGTEEDLDLIGGAESESELEGLGNEVAAAEHSKKKGTSLQDGMSNILKEIALAQGSRVEDSTSSEEEEEEDDTTLDQDASKQQNKPAEPIADIPNRKKFKDARLKCQPRADWFDTASSEIVQSKEANFTPSRQAIEQLHSYARTLLNAENEAFKATQQSSSSQMFYNTVIASGTLSDKISALTLAVQESPLHNVKALENLINLAGKRSRAQAVDVLRALKDLFAQGSLLPSDRRLYRFSTQPALIAALSHVKSWKQGDKLPRGIEEANLICWAFEGWLKEQYFEVLKILEVWCNDEIEFSKGRAVSYVYELLKEKPEQESNLLRLLVNKLGDPVKKIASQASYLVMQLLSTHPAMKMVVVSAIEADFMFRPGQSMHGKYYAAVTLNQTALSSREEDVARKLLDIYFGLFTTLLKPSVKEKEVTGEVESQSRAQRQRQSKKKSLTVENAQSEELREKLVSAVLTGVNRAYPYVGADQKNFTDHLETLFRVTHSANFNTGVQAMLLIQQLTNTHSASSDRFYRTLYESLLDPRLITASKQQLYLNLLHRSLKADMNIKRVKAFVKRLLQILSLHDPSFICGIFFLLKDLEKSYPSLTALVDQAEDHENDEEIFRDVDEDEDGSQAATMMKNGSTSTNPFQDNTTTATGYSPYKRDPIHANADNTCAWEILPFLAHFHPSVNVSADSYLAHTKLPGKPDLSLHTLIHFLDRFVYRNPKLTSNKFRGSSIMQPMASDDSHAVLISSATSRHSQPAVNTDDFLRLKDDDIAADDVFFHKYFTTLGKESKKQDKKRRDVDAGSDKESDEEGEDAIWKAMIESAPDLEGEDGGSADGLDLEDEDMSDMSDFEQEMADSQDSDDDGEVDIEPGIFNDDDDDDEDEEVEDITDKSTQQEPPPPSSDNESEFEDFDTTQESRQARDKKKEKNKADKDRRKKMKALPTFASAEDYAKMLDDDDGNEDEDLG